MNYSKCGVLCVALLCGFNGHASQDLPSFDRVRQQYKESNDLTRVSYLYRRCAALQLNVAALLMKRKQAKAAKDYENLANHYMLLSESVDGQVDQKRGVKTQQSMKTIELSVKYIAQQYEVRMKANHAKRREYVAGDAVLEAELAECSKPESLIQP